ncbi:hypothetical protein BJV82DRAFT_526414, partial [Fennellomyces sp. T-0311]
FFPQRAHTVWWRALHCTIPCHANLHHILPNRFPSPSCILSSDTYLQQHFLWGCPRKQEVWWTIAYRFLAPLSTVQAVHIPDITSPSPPTLPDLAIDGQCVIATTLVAIWSAHWRLQFQGKTFWPQHKRAG